MSLGYKAVSTDAGMPAIKAVEGATYTPGGDEHGKLALTEASPKLKVGEEVEVIPSHCDTTVNLYDYPCVVRDDRVEAIRPIAARGDAVGGGEVIDPDTVFLTKAVESLAGADAAFLNGRYNNTANRCYYACFQAAIYALMKAGIRPAGRSSQWSHAFVPAQFDGQLINRRKLYPSDLRSVIARNYLLREAADYTQTVVSQTEAMRALRRARRLLAAVTAAESDTP